MRDAHVGAVKPMVDFDWAWPKKIDREAIEELFSLNFIKTGHNAVLVGPNGVGKTMILKNVGHHALSRGHTVRFATASDMLAELAGTGLVGRPRPSAASLHRSPAALRRRGRLPFLQQPLCRPALRGRHPALRRRKAAPAQHQQGFLRVERGLPSRRLRRHARRSPHPSRRGHRYRSRQLPPQGSQGAQRRPHQAAKQEAPILSAPLPFTGELHRPQARFSPVNFTEYPRFLVPANNRGTDVTSRRALMVSRSLGPHSVLSRAMQRRFPDRRARPRTSFK